MRIFIGIPTCRRYEPFWQSFKLLCDEMKIKYELEVCIVENQTVAVARNMIAERFLNSNSDYLLFLDDDHSGHSLQMFESILDPIENNGSVMCGIKCFTKTFPYVSNIAVYSHVDEEKLGIEKGRGKYVPIDLKEGFTYCDLMGFGMTLVTKEAFKRIEKPYFFSENNVHEDNYFCDKLVQSGVQPVGCSDHTLQHQDIGKHNAYQLREIGIAKIREEYPNFKLLVS